MLLLVTQNIFKPLLKTVFVYVPRETDMNKTVQQLVGEGIDFFRRIIFPRETNKNIWYYLRRKAAQETADYVENKMLTLPHFDNEIQLLEFSLSKVKKEGLYLEVCCGWEGKSINLIAKRVQGNVHGFDSCAELPEFDSNLQDHESSLLSNKLPKLEENVILHVGWFYKTVPEFAVSYQEQIVFVHIKSRHYTSSKIFFDVLGNRINSGTVIQFDQYFYYPGWKQQEYRAFQEFIIKRNLRYEYLGYCSYGYAVSAVIL